MTFKQMRQEWYRQDIANRLVAIEKDGSVLEYVPTKESETGDEQEKSDPENHVSLGVYYLGLYCVTNAQCVQFVGVTGHRPPDNSFWQALGESSHRVTHVSWDDAVAFATWEGLRLPTQAAWDMTARRPMGLLYPWGNKWDRRRLRDEKNKGVESASAVKVYRNRRVAVGHTGRAGVNGDGARAGTENTPNNRVREGIQSVPNRATTASTSAIAFGMSNPVFSAGRPAAMPPAQTTTRASDLRGLLRESLHRSRRDVYQILTRWET